MFSNSKLTLMARVAAISIVLSIAACGSDEDHKPGEQSEPVTPVIYPEMGFINSVDRADDGTLTCSSDTIPVDLTQDGTLSLNGILVTTTWDESSIKVSYDRPINEPSVIVNNVLGANLNSEAQPDGFVMEFGDEGDWRPGGPADSIVLCHVGM